MRLLGMRRRERKCRDKVSTVGKGEVQDVLGTERGVLSGSLCEGGIMYMICLVERDKVTVSDSWATACGISPAPSSLPHLGREVDFLLCSPETPSIYNTHQRKPSANALPMQVRKLTLSLIQWMPTRREHSPRAGK